ncbi:DNA polymerase III, delta subunit [Enterococcus sp. DIV0755b]|uniref:DNA polymerase III subunit delta n=1 Tax=Enterococcus sp. DIV0755b TaxID=2774657 RepID=UPI003F28DE27
MKAQEALQAIKEKPLAPLYLVLGTESYLQDRIKQAFMERLQLQKDDLDLVYFDLEQDPLNLVVAEAQAPSLFSLEDKRLIIAENPLFLTAEKKSNVIDQDLTDFLSYLKAPSDSGVVVIIAPYEKLDERKKVSKLLKKQAVVIDVQPLKEQEVERYIRQTLTAENIQLDRVAFDTFMQLTEMDLTKAMQELDKLILYGVNGAPLTKEVILQLVPKSLENNIFELTENVLKGDADKALRIYEDLHLQGEETIKINAILIGQVRLLLQTKILTKAGYQQANIAQTLKVHPYRVKLAMQQVRKYDEKQLMDLYDELVENDYLVKTGQMDKEFLFQLFVLKSAH